MRPLPSRGFFEGVSPRSPLPGQAEPPSLCATRLPPWDGASSGVRRCLFCQPHRRRREFLLPPHISMCSFQLAENELILPWGLQEVVPSCWAASPAQGIKLGPFWQRWLPWEASPGRMGRTGRVSGRAAALPHPTHPHSQTPGQKSFLPQTYGSCSHRHTQTDAYRLAHKQTGDFVNMHAIAPSAPPPGRHCAQIQDHLAQTRGHPRTQGHTCGCIMGNSHAHKDLAAGNTHMHVHTGMRVCTPEDTHTHSPLHPQLSDEGPSLYLE